MKSLKCFLRWLLIIPLYAIFAGAACYAAAGLLFAFVKIFAFPCALFVVGELFGKYVLGKDRELEVLKIDKWGLSRAEEKGLAWAIMLIISALLFCLFYFGGGSDTEGEGFEYEEEEECADYSF